MNTCAVLVCLMSAATLVAGGSSKQHMSVLLGNLFGRKSIVPYTGEEACDPEVTVCDDDKLTFCAYGIANVTVPCSALFDGKPGYCDCENSQCTPTRPICYHPDTEKCTKKGKLPDPKDCRKFTYCNGETKKSLPCPDEMIYDPETEKCSTSQKCHSVMCNPKKVLEYVPFPQSPKFYLFCYFGVGEVRECSQPGYMMQDNKCQYQCKKEGLFADPKVSNCKKGMWHSCTYSKSKVLVRKTNYCGKEGTQQLYFNENMGMCMTDDVCSPTSSTTLQPTTVKNE